jgi:predicted GNAT family acetyltransferase
MLGFRAATLDDLDLLVPWMRAFRQEELAEKPEDFDEASIRGSLDEKISRGWRYLLMEEGQPVSTLAITAEAFGLLQVGGIFTPPEYRSRGYATRLLTAFAHFHLNALGAKRIVLQVGDDNLPALRAYEKVGFRSSGNYRFVFCQ